MVVVSGECFGQSRAVGSGGGAFAVEEHTVGRGFLAIHQRATRGNAHWARRVSRGKSCTFRGELVDRGSLYDGMPITTQTVATLLISHDKQNIHKQKPFESIVLSLKNKFGQ